MFFQDIKLIQHFKDFLETPDFPGTEEVMVRGNVRGQSQELNHYEHLFIRKPALLLVIADEKAYYFSMDLGEREIPLEIAFTKRNQDVVMAMLTQWKSCERVEFFDILHQQNPALYDFFLFHLNLFT